MNRRLLFLMILVVAGVVAFNTYSLLNLEKKVDDLTGKVVAVPLEESSAEAEKAPVDVIVIKDTRCEKCTDLTKIVESLKGTINIGEVSTLDRDSGSTLIKKYQLERLPVVIFSPALSAYEDITQNWLMFGKVSDAGDYLLTNANPPFMDLKTGEVQGLVKMVTLVDESCEECYDPSIHKLILDNMGVARTEELVIDVNSDEGKSLVEKYKIETVPTIILSKEVGVYQLFTKAWSTVGSVENDGSFVYRSNDVLAGKHKVLSTGEVVSGKTPADALAGQPPVQEAP